MALVCFNWYTGNMRSRLDGPYLSIQTSTFRRDVAQQQHQKHVLLRHCANGLLRMCRKVDRMHFLYRDKTVRCPGEADLLGQCQQGLAHGVLLTWRYVIEATNWTALMHRNSTTATLKQHLWQFFTSIMPCLELCLSVLQTQAGIQPGLTCISTWI